MPNTTLNPLSCIASPIALNAALLGNTAKSLTPPVFTGLTGLFAAKTALSYPLDAVGSRIERFALQSVARSCLGSKHRTAACLRNRIAGASTVAVKYSKLRARASYGNLQTCGSVWACPICASKVSEHRRAELVALTDAHKQTGGVALLATRTFPHHANQSLETLLSALSVAENKYKQGNPWRKLVARFGLVGTVRTIECTYGANGWHPHIHEILLLKAPLTPDNHAALQTALYLRWVSAATRAGLPTPSTTHGLDLRDGTHAAKYVSKWGIEAELTKWHLKRGKNQSLTPFDFLRIALDGSEASLSARSLYIEYATAFSGRRQLVYSPGLRNLYLTTPEQTDEEAAAGTDDGAAILANLNQTEWKHILRHGLRGELLEAVNAANGSETAIPAFLNEHLG